MPRISRSSTLCCLVVVAILTLLTWTLYRGELVGPGGAATLTGSLGDSSPEIIHGAGPGGRGADSQHVTTEVKSLSEHPNITVRREYQRMRVDELCRKYQFKGEELWADSSDNFRRHLIFEDQRKVIYCFIPKVGCTNLKRLMLYMGGHLPLKTVDWEWVEDKTFLEPALKSASFMNKTLSDSEKNSRLQTYFKFMIARNPLERLVSAFRNKIEPVVNFKLRGKFPNSVKISILMRYRKEETEYWLKTANSALFNISVTFTEYVHFLIETDKIELNEHFLPTVDICHPCQMRYDFYGNFKTMSRDVAQLISQIGTDPRFYHNVSLHSPGTETGDLLPSYYGKLSNQEKFRVLAWLYEDLLFYFTLYPSESEATKRILGLDVSVPCENDAFNFCHLFS